MMEEQWSTISGGNWWNKENAPVDQKYKSSTTMPSSKLFVSGSYSIWFLSRWLYEKATQIDS